MTFPSPMKPHPGIFEINTWPWLNELSDSVGQTVTLANVPDSCWDDLEALGIDAVWLMGVWQRSPLGARIAQLNDGLMAYGQSILPRFGAADVIGSAYCVRGYVPDDRMGGFPGLDRAREQLSARGISLILDYVPNHVAPDHGWVADHPDYFIRGTEAELADRSADFVRTESGVVLARGRALDAPPWPDVVQLNGFDTDVREAAVETLTTIGEHCDGVRCDMAMLLMNETFTNTWGARAGPAPVEEYWPFVLAGVRRTHPDMTFVAEAYWNLQGRLIEDGFDYCYDDDLYHRLVKGEPEPVRLHLWADYSHQRHLVRYVENHDEPRANEIMSGPALRAAAVVISTLPGAPLYHDGQLSGRRLRVPVEFSRRPAEARELALLDFYHRAIPAGRAARGGTWWFCEVHGWPDNDRFRNIIAWCWRAGDKLHVTVVNLAPMPSQGNVRLPADALPTSTMEFADMFTGKVYEWNRADILEGGLYVKLAEHGFHLLRCG